MTEEALQEPSEPVETEAPVVENAESAPAVTEDTSAPEPEKSGVQKRIDQLTWQAREAERRALAAEQQLQERSQPQPAGKPKLEQFDDYDSYVEALAGYKAQESIQAMAAQQSRAQQEALEAQRAQSFRQKADAFAVEHPDFQDVVFNNPYLPITGEMKTVIESSDRGAEVAYHLGQNPQEAARIAQMHPMMQAAELGKIEATLSLPKTRKTTSAPAPIEPIGGGEAGQKDPSKMSTAEFIAWRNAQTQRR